MPVRGLHGELDLPREGLAAVPGSHEDGGREVLREGETEAGRLRDVTTRDARRTINDFTACGLLSYREHIAAARMARSAATSPAVCSAIGSKRFAQKHLAKATEIRTVLRSASCWHVLPR